MDAVDPSRRARLVADIAANCLPSWKAAGVRGKDVTVRNEQGGREGGEGGERERDRFFVAS